MTESPRATPNSEPSTVERSSRDAATAGPGRPGSMEGPVDRHGGEPTVVAQNEAALVPQNAQLAITSSADQQTAPDVLDAEGKINSGQIRSGLERNRARHSAFRPYER